MKKNKSSDFKTGKGALSILSIVAGAIMIVIWLIIWLYWHLPCHQGDSSRCNMAVAIIEGGYMYTFAPLLSISATVFGVLGIGKKENGKFRWLAVLGLLLGLIGDLIILFYFKS